MKQRATAANCAGDERCCAAAADMVACAPIETDDENCGGCGVRCVEENLDLVQRGRLVTPADADIVNSFISDGQLNGEKYSPSSCGLTPGRSEWAMR